MKKFVRSMFAIVLAVSMAVSAGALAYAAGGEPDTAPCTDGRYFWKIEGKTKQSDVYGSWKELDGILVSKSAAPLDITFNVTTTYRNTVTGEVKVSYSTVESTVGFEFGDDITVGLTATKKDAAAGKYVLRARPVYKCWKVKQQRYYTIDGVTTKAGSPVYCYAKKYSYAQKNIVKK